VLLFLPNLVNQQYLTFQSVNTLQLGKWLAASSTKARRQSFTEEHMKSLSDMAVRYDEWANEHEATARQILASLDSFAGEIREHQRWRASWLMADAAKLRAKAAELRKVERPPSINCVSPLALGILAKS
jgi:hypothetical protein